MNIAQIEINLQKLIKDFKKESFIYDLLLAYDQPKASITRLQKGGLNLSKISGEIAWKKKLFFKEVIGEDLHDLIDTIATHERTIKHNPRFIIVTNYETLLAVDRKTGDTLDIPIHDIAKHFDFFLPWAGMEKAQHQIENPADVKAAEKMAKLYDEIKKDNPAATPANIHNLNVFFSRLLFCFFAEDTGIFEKTQFTNAIASHTQQDGSDLHIYLDNLFEVMNTDADNRNNLPAFLMAFPYVNGGLFQNRHLAPLFSRKSRQVLIECGNLQWKDIHPDIFGSMIQAVVTPEERGDTGMHYTSVPNIMKVIEPLFLDSLYGELNAGLHEPRRLQKLLERISKIKIFDPACGSGNFLIIAYKELRMLEIKILQQLQALQKAATGFEPKQIELIPKAQLTLAASYQQSLFSRIELSQFYGIELADFAHEVAILSLWLAQHQMNMKFKEIFGTSNPTLPLQAGGNIVQGNATRLDWEIICPKKDGDETYILGNPPYKGARFQSIEQKKDIQYVFKGIHGHNSLDYIACWFYKGAIYINNILGQLSFVSTNSICQGEQVSLIWPHIFALNINIGFAYQVFRWTNNAKNKAVVAVVIIGLYSNKISRNKYLFTSKVKKQVNNISPYLTENRNIIISKRQKPFKSVPDLVYGNQAIEGGHLILSDTEKNTLINKYPALKKYIRRLFGAKDFMDDRIRWCIWVSDNAYNEAKRNPDLKDRFNKVVEFRKKGGEVAQSLILIPYRFRYIHEAKKNLLIIPRTTSVRREYLPVGFKEKGTIVTDSIQVIYDAEPYIMGILSSKIHMIWVKSVAGGIKTDIGYSNSLCYNSFPFPELSDSQKSVIERNVFNILDEREHHSEKTLAQLYDPKKMPQGLREAHHQLDLAVERCYLSKPFDSDEERLEYLFKLYEQMIDEEKQQSGELIFEQPKTKKKRK